MSGPEIVPTMSAYLELKAERAGMQEGYGFLDEKRLILASEILAVLAAYERAVVDWNEARTQALDAVRAAVGRHGFESLSVYPADDLANCRVATNPRRVLGVRVESALDAPTAAPESASSDEDAAGRAGARILHSPEAESCRACFRRLVPIAAELAVLTGDLLRLRDEYLRTARRARALEDVLLPEIDADLHAVDAALEELEREEAVRVRRAGTRWR